MRVAKGRILVVDDDVDIRETLEDRLASEGYEVLTSADGVEAMEQIRLEDPDLVLLDLEMPELDGMAVLHRLARVEGRPSQPWSSSRRTVV